MSESDDLLRLRAPRALSKSPTCWKTAPVNWLLGLIFLGVGVIQLVVFYLIGGNPLLDLKDWDAANQAEATLDRYEETGTHSGSYYHKRFYFTFTPEGAEAPVQGSSIVGSREREAPLLRALERGETVSVEYLPEDPTKYSRIKGTHLADMPWFLFLFPVAFIVAGAILYWLARRKRVRFERLLTVGEVTRGTVTGTRYMKSVNVGSRHPLIVEYAFEPRPGMPHQGRTTTLRKEAIEQYKEGAEVMVCFDGDSPERNISPDVLGFEFVL